MERRPAAQALEAAFATLDAKVNHRANLLRDLKLGHGFFNPAFPRKLVEGRFAGRLDAELSRAVDSWLQIRRAIADRPYGVIR
jgi:hypothetical protein